MPNLGDVMGSSAIFQPSLPLPVHDDCHETVSIMSKTCTSPNRYSPSTSSSPAPRSVFEITQSSPKEIPFDVNAETRWKRAPFSLDVEMGNYATFPRVRRSDPPRRPQPGQSPCRVVTPDCTAAKGVTTQSGTVCDASPEKFIAFKRRHESIAAQK